MHTVEVASPTAAQVVASSIRYTASWQGISKAAQAAMMLLTAETHVVSKLDGKPEYWLADDWQLEMADVGTATYEGDGGDMADVGGDGAELAMPTAVLKDGMGHAVPVTCH